MQRTPTKAGVFIVLEGVEGSGKSTQARCLQEALASAGYDTVLTHEPGATDLGIAVREILLEGGIQPVAPAELFLYLADRAQHVSEVIKPALERGAVVVCDRFSPSTIAYQGAGRGLGTDLVAQLCAVATGGLEPDLVLVLDLAPDLGLRRISHGPDRMESEPVRFHERVREAYLELARSDSTRFAVLDGSLPPDRVAEAVSEVVRERTGLGS